MSFVQKLKGRWETHRAFLCVGLDPLPHRFPPSLRDTKDHIFEFNRRIIEATHSEVCAYKPQIAHYSARSAEDQLEKTIEYLKKKHPEIPVILDAKRGDIGSTAEQYAREAFVRYEADAVTVNPYLGGDSLAPFLEWKDRGIILLCKTSNPGSRDLQELEVQGDPLYLHMAKKAVHQWNGNGNVALVVGATDPNAVARVRKVVGDLPFLVPGLGAQKGDLAGVLKAGLDSKNQGLILSSSRGIIYASEGEDFAEAAQLAAKDFSKAVRSHLN